jgi:heme exporter protein B
MSTIGALLRRDLAQMFGGARRGATMLPVLFFIAVAML